MILWMYICCNANGMCEVVTGAGVLHSLGGALVADTLVHANIVGAASFPCFLPPSNVHCKLLNAH